MTIQTTTPPRSIHSFITPSTIIHVHRACLCSSGPSGKVDVAKLKAKSALRFDTTQKLNQMELLRLIGSLEQILCNRNDNWNKFSTVCAKCILFSSLCVMVVFVKVIRPVPPFFLLEPLNGGTCDNLRE